MDVKHGPLASLGQDLARLYTAFDKGGASDNEVVSLRAFMRIEGDQVGVTTRAKGSLGDLVAELKRIGMAIEAADPGTKTVQGLIPIANLPELAASTEATGILPMYRPMTG